MRSRSVPATFCEPDTRNTSQNAKHGHDLFNSFSTPVLSISITQTDNCAGCNSWNRESKAWPQGRILSTSPVQSRHFCLRVRMCSQESRAGADRAFIYEFTAHKAQPKSVQEGGRDMGTAAQTMTWPSIPNQGV